MGDAAGGGMRKIQAGDGHALDCWVVPAQGARRGGLVILQEIFGVTAQLKGVAADYAAQGYQVAIPALYDRHAPGSVIPFKEAARGREIMLSLRPEQTMADIEAARAMLAGEGGKVAALGFCWGGGLALRAAQGLEVAAAVSFYGTRLGNLLDKPLKAPFQAHFGTKDDHTPPELVARFRAAHPEAEVHLYEAGHAFANEQRPTYLEPAAVQAHERAAAFLARHVGEP
jgi:carboxymethylenebutenolidase